MAFSDNLKGAFFMSASMAGFVVNDAIIKVVSADNGVALFQSIFIRGLFAMAFIGLLAWVTGSFKNLPGRRDHKKIAWRSVAEMGATISFLSALMFMPLANITAILQALPLTVTIAAAFFLAEPFGWRRLAAIVIGFIGVLLIVQPGTSGFNSYALLALLCVLLVTWRDLIVRTMSKSVSNLYMAFITASVICAMGLVGMFATTGWEPIATREILLLACAAFFLFIGYLGVVSGMRIGEVGFVTPYRYTGMIWALLVGYWVWGEVPNFLASIGIACVVAAGFFTLLREQKRQSEAA